MAGTEKRRLTEQKNTVQMGLEDIADCTFEWREVAAQVKTRKSVKMLDSRCIIVLQAINSRHF